MYGFPIGVMVDSFRTGTYEAIKRAADLGAKGLQMYASKGENSPDELTVQKKRELLDYVKSNGLVFSALCGDLGMGFGNKDLNPTLIEKSKRILDLAKDLETDIVTTHIGVVPASKDHERYKIMQDACRQLAEYADSIGSHFAVETGPEPSATLKGFLDSLESTGVGVNLDPANLVMVIGESPVESVKNLQKYIVHTHAKDGVMLQKTNPEYIYGVTPGPDDLAGISFFREVPLGEGNVHFDSYLKALEECGYRGFLTIEREVGDDPGKDIGLAIEFLNKTIKEN